MQVIALAVIMVEGLREKTGELAWHGDVPTRRKPRGGEVPHSGHSNVVDLDVKGCVWCGRVRERVRARMCVCAPASVEGRSKSQSAASGPVHFKRRSALLWSTTVIS